MLDKWGSLLLMPLIILVACTRSVPSQATLAPQTIEATPTPEGTRLPSISGTEYVVPCWPPRRLGEVSSEEFTLAVEAIEAIQPGSTRSDDVVQLLGEPDVNANDAVWAYHYDNLAGGLEIAVYYREEGIVELLNLGNAMTLAQLVQAFGDPSRTYRSTGGEERPPGRLNLTILFYDERAMTILLRQGLCEFPTNLVIDDIFIDVPGAPYDDILSGDAVELEWPGLTE